LKQELADARKDSNQQNVNRLLDEIYLWIEGQPITRLLTALQALASPEYEKNLQADSPTAAEEYRGKSKLAQKHNPKTSR
jgi:hypothetical protein